MYLASEGLRFLAKSKSLKVSDADKSALDAYKKQLDHSTKFIPTWVKVAVAIAFQRSAFAAAMQARTRSRSSGVSTPAGGALANVTR